MYFLNLLLQCPLIHTPRLNDLRPSSALSKNTSAPSVMRPNQRQYFSTRGKLHAAFWSEPTEANTLSWIIVIISINCLHVRCPSLVGMSDYAVSGSAPWCSRRPIFPHLIIGGVIVSLMTFHVACSLRSRG